MKRKFKRLIRSPLFLAMLASACLALADKYRIEELRWVAGGIGTYLVYRGIFK